MSDIVYGLTPDGFVIKSLEVIRAELQQALQAAFGASIDLGDKSVFGQIVGIQAEREALLWELAQAVNASQDPSKASDASLDALCTLTGTFRPPASYSTVVLTLFGDPATVVPSGTAVATTSSLGKVQFATTASATIAAVPAWVAATAYTIGNRVFHDTDKIYQCITAGTSAGSGGPTGTSLNITDGAAHWEWLMSGVTGGGAVDVLARAANTGPVTAVAGDLAVIVNAVVGFDFAKNLLDATLGRDVATDAELRTLREQELSNAGNATVNAIISHLTEILGVISTTVFVNDQDLTDSDGLPPHSVECLVRTTWAPDATADQVIVDTIFGSVAAGITTYGSSSGTAMDTQGTTHTVKFSRPTEIPIYVSLTLAYDASLYPADGDAQVKAAIVAYGDASANGKDAVASGVLAQAFKVLGVLDVSVCHIGLAPAPTLSVTIPIALRQLATFDTSRCVVTSSPATP